MAGRIRQQDIALVRERSPIADVVGDYLQLRNAGGGDLKGLCPFHEEKSPSFNVTPARGLYWCFGCGEGGDVITFVQKLEHLTFAEAVERLAARAGVELRYEEGGYTPRQDQGQRARLVEAHRAAAEFYAEQLAGPEAELGRRFLGERGFEPADAAVFGVGYSPTGWEVLVRHLRGRGFTDQELITGGLAREGRRGPMDRFRGRLIWPIRDVSGDVIGFGARRLREDDDGPKYLNTPDSPLFKKSTVLYGADLAKREMGKRRQAVIVEGYTDVMACHLAGVPTAVATCGTSFGAEHAKLLRRLVMDQPEAQAEVIFTFDGDAAGRRAAVRAFDQDHRFAAQTFVAVQADGLDPCDLRRKHGDAAVRELVASRTGLFEFVIRTTIERYDLTTNEGRLAALDAAAPVVAGIKDAGLRRLYAASLDRWLGIMNEEFVLRRVREQSPRQNGQNGPNGRESAAGQSGQSRQSGRAGPGGSGGPAGPGGMERDPADPDVQREWELLKFAVQRPGVLGPAFDELPAAAFGWPEYAAVREVIGQIGGVCAATGPDWAQRLREAAPNEQVQRMITRLGVEPLRYAGESEDRYATELLSRIWERQLTRDIANLKAKLERLNPAEQADEYARLFGDLVALEQQRRQMRERGLGSQ